MVRPFYHGQSSEELAVAYNDDWEKWDSENEENKVIVGKSVLAFSLPVLKYLTQRYLIISGDRFC
jgi:hypothetical protein